MDLNRCSQRAASEVHGKTIHRAQPITAVVYWGLCAVCFVSSSVALRGQDAASSEPASAQVAYLSITVTDAHIGGRPAQSTVTYIASDRTIQKAVLQDDDVTGILSTNAPVLTLFEGLIAVCRTGEWESKKSRRAEEGTPQRMTESVLDSYRLDFRDENGDRHYWIGSAADKPRWVQDLDGLLVTNELAALQPESVPDGEVFCRAIPLQDNTVREYRKAGILTHVSATHLTQNDLLSVCLEFPCRFVPVKNDQLPFAPFRRVFQPGRDAMNFWHEDEGLQVRVYK